MASREILKSKAILKVSLFANKEFIDNNVEAKKLLIITDFWEKSLLSFLGICVNSGMSYFCDIASHAVHK